MSHILKDDYHLVDDDAQLSWAQVLALVLDLPLPSCRQATTASAEIIISRQMQVRNPYHKNYIDYILDPLPHESVYPYIFFFFSCNLSKLS